MIAHVERAAVHVEWRGPHGDHHRRRAEVGGQVVGQLDRGVGRAAGAEAERAAFGLDHAHVERGAGDLGRARRTSRLSSQRVDHFGDGGAQLQRKRIGYESG